MRSRARREVVTIKDSAAVSEHPDSTELLLEPEDNERLRNLSGQLDEHLRQIERRLGIEISNRGNFFRLYGDVFRALPLSLNAKAHAA